ncbi:unnamed protein product [Ostreobium quekettii]|nr:unnamed protein product [Ostreobium quekettii]
MTSVIGHVLSIDFPPRFQNWDTTDPATLFSAPTIKTEANPKAHVCKHLQNEAKDCDYLVLWLDCDREGENICFEVMDNTVKWMRRRSGQQVFRAQFSSISASEIKAAMRNLGKPNENEALAVDARQELDLKVGVAFTRFQTRFFQGKYGNLDSALISYGPCQTPTLNFCVERHQKIISFEPEPFWTVRVHVAKSGLQVQFDWERGRVFDQAVGAMFQKSVQDGKSLKITSVIEKESRSHRPCGLNTVEMLKIASSSLNIGPHHTMQIAERLYIQGYMSYPRTESSAYSAGFDINGTIAAQRGHPIWGQYARGLLEAGVSRPKGGVDAGDHPPITPVRSATEADLGGGDAWRLYDYVVRHFLASVSPDCVLKKTEATGTCGGETFSASGRRTIKPGYVAVMPWKKVEGEDLPPLREGEVLPVKEVELHQGKTSPPGYLSESELISLMEKNGIGTDASISVHINNICERNYVQIQAGRSVVPTELGITLIKGYQLIDPELCRAQVRAHVEAQISLIAKGQADKQAVVDHSLLEFQQKFTYFVDKIDKMDALFEASFSPLSSSGKPFGKCGICHRYTKYIPTRPARIYCPTCEDVYPVPQGGTVKQYGGLTCPLDGFELALFSLGGKDGKTYPFCPYCFSHPPFEDAKKVGAGSGKSGMPCTTCLHPTCPNSVISLGVSSCPDCDDGTLVLDPVSAPSWRLDCSCCSFLIYLPENLHSAKLSQGACQDCESTLLELDWKKSATPLANAATKYTACVVCDDFLRGLCQMKHGHTFFARGGGRRGRGRGRGRRGRGRGRGGGRGKNFDPKMSFSDF